MKRIALTTLLCSALALPALAAAAESEEEGNRASTGAGTTPEPTAWANGETGVVGNFTGVTVERDGATCREYTVEATIAGQQQLIYGLACPSCLFLARAQKSNRKTQ